MRYAFISPGTIDLLVRFSNYSSLHEDICGTTDPTMVHLSMSVEMNKENMAYNFFSIHTTLKVSCPPVLSLPPLPTFPLPLSALIFPPYVPCMMILLHICPSRPLKSPHRQQRDMGTLRAGLHCLCYKYQHTVTETVSNNNLIHLSNISQIPDQNL